MEHSRHRELCPDGDQRPLSPAHRPDAVSPHDRRRTALPIAIGGAILVLVVLVLFVSVPTDTRQEDPAMLDGCNEGCGIDRLLAPIVSEAPAACNGWIDLYFIPRRASTGCRQVVPEDDPVAAGRAAAAMGAVDE